MNNFDMRNAKFIGILLTICLVFMLVVMNAYKYIPDNKDNMQNITSETNVYEENNDYYNEEENNYNNQDVEDENITEEQEKISPVNDDEKISPLENISEDNNNEEASSDFNEILTKARELKSDKQLVEAIQTYEQALALADSNKTKADCYEEIAQIYAVSKRYGKALDVAQKAYNLYPSTSREMLIARLYFKTGEVDKANTRMENVLKRDFSLD